MICHFAINSARVSGFFSASLLNNLTAPDYRWSRGRGAEQSRFLPKMVLLPELLFSFWVLGELSPVWQVSGLWILFWSFLEASSWFLYVLTLRSSSSIGFIVKALKSSWLYEALGVFLKTDGLCYFLISVSGLVNPFKTFGTFFDFGDTKSFKFFLGLRSSPMNRVGRRVSKSDFFVT